MRFRKINPLILLFFGATFFAQSATGMADGVSDGEAQVTLAQTLPNKAEFDKVSRDLKLDLPFDFRAAIADTTVVEKVKMLTPLRLPNAGMTSGVTKDDKAFIAMATRWDKNSDGAKLNLVNGILTISVCWIDLDESTARGRRITQDAISATWEYYGAIRFDWSKAKCNENSKGIRIAVVDDRPWSYYGKTSNSYNPSMILNFQFQQPVMAGCYRTADLCIWSIAVHEFGHALGYIHEQDSSKTPKWCKAQLDPADIQKPAADLKATMLTKWDRYSVMDYCQDIYSHRVQLSDCDIAAYQAAYPAKTTYKPACKITAR